MIEMAISILLEILLLMIGILKRRSSIILFSISVFIWIYVSFSFDSADIVNYRYAYDNNIYLGKDPLFFSIQNFFVNKGWSFTAFKIFLGTVISTVFFYIINKYKDCKAILATICIFIPCISFATQIRSGLAGVIAFSAIYILTAKGKGKIIIYIFLVLLASFIHQSALVYLVLVIPCFVKGNKNYLYFVRGFTITLICVLLVAPTSISLIVNALIKIDNVHIQTLAFRLNQMFSGEYKATIIGFLFNAMHHFIIFLCADYSQKKEILLLGNMISENELKRVKFERAINNTLLVFIPLYIISFHFVRTLYYVLPFMYAIAFSSIFRMRKYSKIVNYGRIQIMLMFIVTIFVFIWGIIQEPNDYIRIIQGIFRG